MTTIAFKDGVLASDSRVTVGSMITSDNFQKLFRLNCSPFKGDILIACGIGGAMEDVFKIVDYLNFEPELSDVPKHDVGCVIVGQKYVYHLENDLIRYNKKEFLTEGTGGTAALSAMKLGLSAKEAVKHAMKIDCYSGGKIQVLTNL